MKKLLFVTISVFILLSCTSREDKINKLIQEEMFKTLFDFESYELIEIKIDSAYNSLRFDGNTLQEAYTISRLYDEVGEGLEKFNEALKFRNLWSGIDYKKAKQYEAESREIYKKTGEKSIELYEAQLKLLEINDTISHGLIGWRVEHKFRCKTKGGFFDIGNYLYIVNLDMTDILYTINLDDEKEIMLNFMIETTITKDRDEIKKSLADTKEVQQKVLKNYY